MGWLKKSGLIVDLFDYSCRLGRIAGVLPFVINGARIKISKMLLMYDVMLVLCHILIDIMLTYFTIVSERRLSFVSRLIQIAQQVASTATLVISLFWIVRSKPTVQEALDELLKFEEIVCPKGLYLNLRVLGVIYTSMISLGMVELTIAFNPSLKFFMRVVISLRFHMSTWMLFSISSNFTSFIKIVEKCYKALSDSVVTKMKTSQNLKDVQKAAEHLVSACEALNAAYGPQMLLITSTSFVLITVHIYIAIMVDKSANILLNTCWIIIFTKIMLHLISSCSSAVEAADEFEKTLYRTVLEDRSGNLSQEVRSCLHFTNNRKVEFNAFGFFSIDFTLAGSMIAAGTTYLVILIQMGSAEKSVATASELENTTMLMRNNSLH